MENSLLHGLKNKGYKGAVVISAQKSGEDMLVTIMDTGSGFAEGKKEQVNSLLTNYAKQAAKAGALSHRLFHSLHTIIHISVHTAT